MDIIALGARLLGGKLGLSEDQARTALAGLLGGGDGQPDIAGLVSRLGQSGGLSDIVASWLGDGDNQPVSADSLKQALGGNLSEFASKLGVDENQAAEGLAEALPQMVDKGSSGGQLLDSLGGVQGALGMAKKFFG